jgi:DNA-binding MarR family transcriptional regulator
VACIINDLKNDGLVSFEPNPHHKRAQLVVLTPKGQQAYEGAVELYNPLIAQLGDGLSIDDIAAAQRVLTRLRARLEAASIAE